MAHFLPLRSKLTSLQMVPLILWALNFLISFETFYQLLTSRIHIHTPRTSPLLSYFKNFSLSLYHFINTDFKLSHWCFYYWSLASSRTLCSLNTILLLFSITLYYILILVFLFYFHCSMYPRIYHYLTNNLKPFTFLGTFLMCLTIQGWT